MLQRLAEGDTVVLEQHQVEGLGAQGWEAYGHVPAPMTKKDGLGFVGWVWMKRLRGRGV
jgi:hypothetical protein